MTKKIFAALFYFRTAGLPIDGNELFEKAKERLISVTTIKGTISITYETGQMYSGEFQYMPPGKIFIDITDPPGKKIVSNGKRLWVYDSSSDLCGVQDLFTRDAERDRYLSEEEKKANEYRMKGGLEFFFSGYDASILADEPGGYTVELKNESRFYKDVVLRLDRNCLIQSARFTDKQGVQFAIRLSNMRFNEKIFTGVFDFNVPANAQLVKNPLDVR
ncbi:MAG: outer-membrane lipoprotein carrier protein LolA [Spirochaetes bacterium]|nr:outer-membrane lipoprotein carrier protein LolA [Spirochaetota bacterium]